MFIAEGITDHDLDTFVDMYREHCEVGRPGFNLSFGISLGEFLFYPGSPPPPPPNLTDDHFRNLGEQHSRKTGFSKYG